VKTGVVVAAGKAGRVYNSRLGANGGVGSILEAGVDGSRSGVMGPVFVQVAGLAGEIRTELTKNMLLVIGIERDEKLG